MALQMGDRYHCRNCQAELVIVHGASQDHGGDLPLRCCCGQDMELSGRGMAGHEVHTLGEFGVVAEDVERRLVPNQPTGKHD